MQKKIGLYKIVNIILAVFFGIVATGINYYLNQGYCVDACSFESLNGFIKPVYFFSYWFSILLLLLLLIPSHIFRKWLFYVAPPVLLLTLYLVLSISVYSSNLLNPTRAKMAENGMFVLGVFTLIFVLVHLFLEWKKKQQI